MNRIDRLTAILIYLQTKRWVTGPEISKRFDISLRTVYRDMKALDEAGVPIGAEAGRGYYLIEGYHLPPVMFTRTEAGALLIAGKLVDKLTDISVQKQFHLAANKIIAVLPASEKDVIEELDNRVEVLFTPIPERIGFANNFITGIQQALVSKKCLLIDYESFYSQEKTNNRLIDPLGLVYYSNTWHLIGYCKLRNDMRDFRVDRILSMKITGDCASTKRPDELKKYFEKIWNGGNLSEVTIWFDNSIASSLVSVKYYYGYVAERIRDEGVEMDFAVSDYFYIARWLLSFSDKIEIVKPPELKKIMVDLVQNLAKVYLSRVMR